MMAFMSRKSTSKTEIAAPGVPGGAQHLALFGPPLLIEGEDPCLAEAGKSMESVKARRVIRVCGPARSPRQPTDRGLG